MDMGLYPDHPTSPTTPSLHLCALCRKSFDQETSHSRHVQYCRRRAARKQPARPVACYYCRRTKSKCDFQQPCSRCVAKEMACSYGRLQGMSTATTTAAPSLDVFGSSGSSGGDTLGTVTTLSSVILGDVPVAAPWPDLGTGLNLGLRGDDYTFDDDMGAHYHDSTTVSAGGSNGCVALSCLPQSTMAGVGPTLLSRPFPHEAAAPSFTAPVASAYPKDPMAAPYMDARSLVPIPSRTMTRPELSSSPGRYISHGCRQFIMSILRTYPRMMTRPANLPPFIHPLGCSLHYNERQQQQQARPFGSFDSTSAAFTPLKPLAACHGLAYVFAARNANTEGVLWRTLTGEQRQIMNEMHLFSRGETLAAIQAMVIYTIMRLIDSGREYFAAHRDMLLTMKNLSERFCQLSPGPFSPAHEPQARPCWEDWLFEETRRRISIVCFLLALVVGAEGTEGLSNPFLIPLPSSKSLWEATSAWSWEQEYVGSCGGSRADQGRLETLGDLAAAQRWRVVGGGDETVGGELGCGVDDALDEWHAGLDGLGVMLAAVMADV